jgi:hypothetical protein
LSGAARPVDPIGHGHRRVGWPGHVLIVILVAMANAAASDAADESGASFVARLRAVVATGNRRAAAAMFRYPLRVNSPMLPLPIPLDNAASTLNIYDLLFTPEMRCAIDLSQPAQTGKPLPNYPLVVNGDALTIGQGLIVAERTAGLFRITRMTIIGVPDGRKPNAPVVTTDIDLRFKGMVRQVAGNLAGDAFDRYTIAMTKGAILQAKLERFKGLEAVLRVTDGKGQPVDQRADGKRTWAAAIPASAMYRVEVVRKLPFCDPPITYLLTLSAR